MHDVDERHNSCWKVTVFCFQYLLTNSAKNSKYGFLEASFICLKWSCILDAYLPKFQVSGSYPTGSLMQGFTVYISTFSLQTVQCLLARI